MEVCRTRRKTYIKKKVCPDVQTGLAGKETIHSGYVDVEPKAHKCLAGVYLKPKEVGP